MNVGVKGLTMAGPYKGVQACISEINAYALFSNCAAHSINLCSVNAAESCQDTITFFGALQQLYKFLSKSPQRWEILTIVHMVTLFTAQTVL